MTKGLLYGILYGLVVSSVFLSNAVASSTSSASTTATSEQPTQTADPGTVADIATIRERRVSFIISGSSGSTNISQWLSTLGSDGKWPDSEIDYTAGCNARRANWPAQSHWLRIVTLASAWNGGLQGAEQYVQDPALLSAISSSMDWWFENDFTDPSCLDSGGQTACPCGTPGLWNTNWFSNIILIPTLVGQGCLLINSNLTPTQLSNCTHITGRSYGTFDHNINGVGFLTGANTLDVAKIGIDQGLLTTNGSIMTDAYRRIHAEVVIENAVTADGTRPDGSFGQHGGIIYNGNYGKDYANDVLGVEIDAGGTQFSAGDASKSAFATLIDGDQWMIYRNVITGVLHWDFSVLGRFISFPVIDDQATGSIKINITEIQQLGELWESDTLTSVYNSLSQTSTNANIGNIEGNRMFFDNDYMVQRGTGYVTTLRMYSTRTKNTECTNAQNPLGFHLADGTMYTYLQGNEYEDISVAWDWNLIPGITVDYAATPLTCGDTQFTGIQEFVGGVSDGHIGAAAMRYTNPLTKALTFQKAWFFLDDDVQHIMIPSIISSTNASIFSVLDQKRHNGPVMIDDFDIHERANITRPQTLWHDNVGYVFDADYSNTTFGLSVEIGPRSGDWASIGISTVGDATVDLFAAWIDHGAGAPAVPVSYTIYPAVNLDAFRQKRKHTQLQNIRNDVDVSAVFDEAHSTVMVVFWDNAGGSVQFSPSPTGASIIISADGNSIVSWQMKTGIVTVSDPSQSLTTLHLNVTAPMEGNRPLGWGPPACKELTFTLPTGGLAGSSVSQILQ